MERHEQTVGLANGDLVTFVSYAAAGTVPRWVPIPRTPADEAKAAARAAVAAARATTAEPPAATPETTTDEAQEGAR